MKKYSVLCLGIFDGVGREFEFRKRHFRQIFAHTARHSIFFHI